MVEAVLRIVELSLEIVLEAMRGQTPDQKKAMWDLHIENMKWWRENGQRWAKLFKLDEPPQ